MDDQTENSHSMHASAFPVDVVGLPDERIAVDQFNKAVSVMADVVTQAAS